MNIVSFRMIAYIPTKEVVCISHCFRHFHQLMKRQAVFVSFGKLGEDLFKFIRHKPVAHA